jgi:hypothetical protein
VSDIEPDENYKLRSQFVAEWMDKHYNALKKFKQRLRPETSVTATETNASSKSSRAEMVSPLSACPFWRCFCFSSIVMLAVRCPAGIKIEDVSAYIFNRHPAQGFVNPRCETLSRIRSTHPLRACKANDAWDWWRSVRG